MAVIDHVPVYGQSWSPGYGGRPTVTLSASDPTNVMMFNGGGPRQRSDAMNENVLNGAGLTSFVGLLEQDGVDGGSLPMGETPCSGLGYWLKPNIANKLLLSANGRGGYSIAQLAKGTQPYTNLQTCLSRAKTIAEAGGNTYRVPALVFLQGDTDEYNNTTATWAANVEQLRLDFQADYRTLVGDNTVVVPMFIYQVSSGWNERIAAGSDLSVVPKIAGVQLAAHETYPNIRLVGPNFIYTYYLDLVHLIGSAYRWHGEYIARAIKEHCYDGVPWECLRPVSLVRNGAVIDGVVTGNSGPIVLDTSLVSDDPAKGFAVQVAGNGVKLSNVLVTGDHTFRLIMASNPHGTTVVNHALPFSNTNLSSGPVNGPRGNLRDSIAPPSVFGNPNLYKWLVHFSKTCQGTS